MMMFSREQLYRKSENMARLHDCAVTICGAGALGANITENLARSGFAALNVIDRDRIEERNLSTQPYYRTDVGAFKAKILANNLYRAIGVKVRAQTKELTAENADRLLVGSALVIDAFDNSTSRQVVKESCDRSGIPCLHAGLAGDYAEVMWNEVYRVPSPAHDDLCDYPLARNLVMLAVAVTCEAIVGSILEGKTNNFTITLKDLCVREYTP
ncbi:MAG: ThiF family adenylyltransferase [Cyanobacteria bacterium J055]|nr:MAG: ThiF family adenylyltransferase [Cyanobacteria bacterium J055]